MEPIDRSTTGMNALEILADSMASLEQRETPLNQRRLAVAIHVRTALETLSSDDRNVLETLLEARGVAGVAIDRILSLPPPKAMNTPSLPFAHSERYQVLAASMTPREGFSPERPNYPQGVAPHLDSHHDQLTQLINAGSIPAEFASTLRLFIELHDRGYAGRTDVLQADEFAAAADEYTATYVTMGASKDQADRMAEYVLAGLRATDNPVKQHLVGRVIGHGVNSVRFGRAVLADEGGMSPERADALATLFATHHLGYPLTPLVDGFAKAMGGEIPPDLRSTFLVGGAPADATLPGAKREEISQDRADAIRAEIADRVAPTLGISTADARAIAVLAYALDRTSPARRMRTFSLAEDDSITWAGGETQKKYPLIVGDINAAYGNAAIRQKPEKHVKTVYNIASVQYGKERDAAIRTARNLGVTGLEEVIREHAAREIAATIDVQRRAIGIADRMGAGSFATIDADIARITEEYRRASQNPEDTDDIDALGYLLGTLRVLHERVKQVFPNG